MAVTLVVTVYFKWSCLRTFKHDLQHAMVNNVFRFAFAALD